MRRSGDERERLRTGCGGPEEKMAEDQLRRAGRELAENSSGRIG